MAPWFLVPCIFRSGGKKILPRSQIGIAEPCVNEVSGVMRDTTNDKEQYRY